MSDIYIIELLTSVQQHNPSDGSQLIPSDSCHQVLSCHTTRNMLNLDHVDIKYHIATISSTTQHTLWLSLGNEVG
jgi:hypothetical protein